LPLGDLTTGQLRVLALLAESYGDGLVRTTPEQNVMLRWVRSGQLPALYRRLAVAGLGTPGQPRSKTSRVARAPSRAVSLSLNRAASRGSSRTISAHPHRSCRRLATCASRSAAARTAADSITSPGSALQGSIRKLGDRVLPQYFLMVGGDTRGEQAAFGTPGREDSGATGA
jgi:hypothetical protein